jgi:transaldolase
LGLAGAVVTDPTVMARWTAGGRSLEEVVTEVCRTTGLPVFVQLHGPDSARFVREAEVLRSVSPQILPVLPPTAAGLAAVTRLEATGVRAFVTTICSLGQAYVTAIAGASYACVEVAAMTAARGDALALIRHTAALYDRHRVRTEIIAAGVGSAEDAEACLAAGAHGVIVATPVFEALFRHEVTRQTLERFERDDWSRIPYWFRERDA